MAGAVLLAFLLALAAYEALAVVRAKERTPEALAKVASRELKLSDIGAERVQLLLLVEDPGFWGHHGVDFTTPGQGRTTITQALVKLMYFDHFRPGFAKIEQSLIARFVLDPAMTKHDQLEAFVNHAGFGTAHGREVVGFADAARTYYGVGFRQLTNEQYISLLAMGVASNALDPIRHRQANAERVRRIEALAAHRCRPRDVADVWYPDCEGGHP